MFDLFIDLCPFGNEDKNQTQGLFKIWNLENAFTFLILLCAVIFWKVFSLCVGWTGGNSGFSSNNDLHHNSSFSVIWNVCLVTKCWYAKGVWTDLFRVIYHKIVALLLQSNFLSLHKLNASRFCLFVQSLKKQIRRHKPALVATMAC